MNPVLLAEVFSGSFYPAFPTCHEECSSTSHNAARFGIMEDCNTPTRCSNNRGYTSCVSYRMCHEAAQQGTFCRAAATHFLCLDRHDGLWGLAYLSYTITAGGSEATKARLVSRTMRRFASSFLCNPTAAVPKGTRCRNNLTRGKTDGAIFTSKRQMAHRLAMPNPQHDTFGTSLMCLLFGHTSWPPSDSKDGLTFEAKPEKRRPSSGQVTLTRPSAGITLYVVSYSPPESRLSLMGSYHDNFHQK